MLKFTMKGGSVYSSLIPYASFTQFTPALPEFYWNVYSSEQRIKHLCMELKKLISYIEYVAVEAGVTGEKIDELQAQFDKFQESGFDDYYREQIEQWVHDNLGSIFETYSRGVYFGLNMEGRFVAYVPESWSDVYFDTGADYTLDTYGRLILRMDVDSPYDHVDQTPEVVRPYSDAELEQKIINIMNTLYSVPNGG